MATIKYWIQIENRPWDVCPNNIDRITGEDLKTREGIDPDTNVTLTSLGTPSHTRTTTMYRSLGSQDDTTKKHVTGDALILRRYKPPTKLDESDAWTIPDDRKINPWDLNEKDPTDNGTMGTIPGPVIECKVGDEVEVHFRNMDRRSEPKIETICFPFPRIGEICFPFPFPSSFTTEQCTHSLHPHGFVFAPMFDGAFPLSPPDPGQPIPASEAAAWSGLGVTGNKKGDRVPPGGTFIYRWKTFGWPTTAGVWLYHDHSICDMDNTNLGAIGIIVIHNPADTNNEVDIRLPEPQQDSTGTALDPDHLPDGSPNGNPKHTQCFPFLRDFELHVLPHDLEGLGQLEPQPHGGMEMAAPAGKAAAKAVTHKGGKQEELVVGPPIVARTIARGDLIFELDKDLLRIRRICFSNYVPPPSKALYLQLYHSLGDAGFCINGRKYLGNTPTMIAGPTTRMRFGVVGMGSDFHTFHIHGHRWIIPGPHGSDPTTIQNSTLDTPVSQFEDTRTFGPANSFVFTIEEGTGFMRADPFTPSTPQSPIGEWHMHCHVLMHMDQGMMGSLLVINPTGGPALALPKGMACTMPATGGGGNGGGGGGATVTIDLQSSQYVPANKTINKGDKVKFVNKDGFQHTVDWDTPGSPANSGNINAMGTAGDTYTTPAMNTGGTTFNFHCFFHGAPGSGMHGSITVNP